MNASFGGPAGGETLRAAIAAYPNTLFVVAAGNGGADEVGDNNGPAPQYPCNVAERNVLCVGASTNQDGRAAFSNFGAVTVDVFAPGQGIASTIAGTGLPHKYAFSDGTSMATPHVAAAAALVLQTEPTLSAGDLKDILLASADAGNAFSGRSLSGGRLNVRAAVELAQVGTSLPDGDGDGFPDAADACATSAASTSADGCPDADEDAVADSVDNCPSTFNPGQQNSDGRADGGDACDQDYDNDGRPTCGCMPDGPWDIGQRLPTAASTSASEQCGRRQPDRLARCVPHRIRDLERWLPDRADRHGVAQSEEAFGDRDGLDEPCGDGEDPGPAEEGP